ncbi:MAG: hypothetical protein ING65_04595 [Rhodocyclaceae bacterium]|nr:hypothetical protein [Rhodocyclaceae bacterium]
MSNGPWLFGAWADSAVFLSGPLAAWVYLLASPVLESGVQGRIDALVVVIGIIVLDRSHTFSTFLRVFGSSSERKRFGQRIGLLALALFAFFLGLHMLSRDLFWTAATYLTVWHVLRQQVGLALYAESAEGRMQGSLERTMGGLHLYLLWGGTLLSVHARENPTLGWYATSELVSFPAMLHPFAVALSCAGVVCYLGLSIWRWSKFAVFHRASFIVWLSSLGGSAVLWTHNPAENRISLILALSVLHSVPYLSACWLVAQKSTVKNTWLERLRPKAVPLGFVFIAVTLAVGTTWQVVGFTALNALQSQNEGGFSKGVLSFAEVIFMLPVVVHNIADSWLWKRSENAEVLTPFLSSDLMHSPLEAGEQAKHLQSGGPVG